MIPKFSLPRWVIPGALLLTACAVAYSWLAPQPKPRTSTKTETRTKSESREVEEMRSKLDERQRIIDQQAQQLRERSSTQANLRTRTVETIRREYAPPATRPAGMQVAASGLPAPESVPAPAPTVEIITRETTTDDQGRSERSVDSDTTRRTETDTQREEATESRRQVDAKTDTSTKTETRTGGVSDSASRVGLGLGLAKGGPGLTGSYDLVQVKLPFRLRAGAGVYGTARVGELLKGEFGKSLDGGPQGNIGGKKLSLMLGYGVRTKSPYIGLQYRVKF